MLLVLSTELLCAVAFSGSALWHERRSRMHAFDVMLQGRSDSILGAVQDAEDPDDNVRIDPVELKVPDSDAYAVYNLGGRVLGLSKNAPDALISRTHDGFYDKQWNGRAFRVYERNAMRVIDRADNGGDGLKRPITIVYAAPTAHIRHEIFEAAGFYILISLVLLTGTAFLLMVLLRRVLRPIEDLASRAANISKESLHFDAPTSVLQVRELAPLANALSSTVSRLRKAFEHEQRFVGDAAHELKTAVAVVRSTIQVLAMRSRSTEEYEDGLARLLQDNQRVEDLISRMLALARMEQQSGPETSTINLGVAVKTTVDNIASFAEARSVAIRFEADSDIHVLLSPEKAEALASNLIVNAIQHSVAGAEVNVEVKQSAGKALLRIRDTGGGITPAALPHIFERFYREDSSRSRDTGGAGLGLAICRSIMQSAGGTIVMESVPGVETIAIATFSLV
jgi:signal transduction histidine kinase